MYADVLTISDGTISVSQNNDLFDEHFPGFAVLPGAFSVACCIDLLLEKINKRHYKKYQLKCIKKASFLRRIVPGMKLSIQLIRIMDPKEKKALAFSLNDELNISYLKGILSVEERK